MGDTGRPVGIEELLAHREWVRRVAFALVRDADAARELEQSLWADVLARPPVVRSSLRGWLATALRHALLRRRRGATRRARREEVAARPEAQPSAAELVARAEAADRVTHAVLELAEPYRSTILLRYVEGIDLAEIASRDGVPIETVRTRHKRALAMLRERLGASGPDAGATWLATLAPLLPARPAQLPVRVAAPAGTAAVVGGVLVANKVAMAVALLLLAGGGAWIAIGRDGGRAGAPSDAAPPSGRSAEALDATARANRSRAAPAEEPLSEVAAAVEVPPRPVERTPTPTWHLRGGFEGLDADAARPRLTVRPVESLSGEQVGAPPVGAHADAAGAFDVDVSAFFGGAVPVSELSVEADAPDYLPVAVRVPMARARTEPDGTTSVALKIPLTRAIVLTGRVEDESGDPVAGAGVGAFDTGPDGTSYRPVDESRSTADGRFRLRLPSQREYVVIASAPDRMPDGVDVAGDAGTTRTLVLRPGARVTGRIVLPSGVQPKGAIVRARPVDVHSTSWLFEDELAWVDGRALRCPARAEATEDGRFAVGGLDPSRRYLVQVDRIQEPWAMSDLLDDCAIDLEKPRDDVDIVIAAARLRIEARFPVVPSPRTVLSLKSTTAEDESTFTVLLLGPGGSELLLRPHAACEVELSAEGFEDWNRSLTAPPAGREIALVAEMEPARPRGVFVLMLKTPAGESIERAAIEFLDLAETDASDAWGQTVTGEENRFSLSGMTLGRYRVIVRPGGEWLGGDSHWLEATTEVDVPADGNAAASVEVRRGGRLRAAARDAEGRLLQARCVVRNSAGDPVPVTFVVRHPGGSLEGMRHALSGAAPCTVDPALPAGSYRLEFSLDGYRPRASETELGVGETIDVEVTLERE